MMALNLILAVNTVFVPLDGVQVFFLFEQKYNSRWISWIYQLDVVLTLDDLWFFSFCIICACDSK